MANDITLRPYQQECVNTIDALPDGAHSIVALATGLGKTVVISRINRKGRMLILSHRDELVRQPEKYFNCTFGIEKADEQASETDEVVSASVQSLYHENRLHRYLPDAFDIIVVDECHHAAAPVTYGKILSYFHPRKLIGLTATPQRGDGASLAHIFDSICFSRDLAWGIKNGYLTSIKGIVIRENDVDLTGVHMTGGDYNASEVGKLLANSHYYVTTADAYMTQGTHEGNHTLIYCIDIASCNIIVSLIRERLPKEKQGEIAIITGQTSTNDRHQIEADYLSGKIRCIVNCMVLTEGSDLPITDRIIVCRPTANPTLYTQIIGRGTRLAEGKESCLVLDILPAKAKHICSITSLVDENINLLPKEVVSRLEEEPVSLEEIQKTVDEIRAKRLGVINTLAEEYDIFEKEVERESKCISQAVESGNFGQSIVDSVYRKDLDIDTSVLPGIHYSIGPTSAMRYQIVGNRDETVKAWVSEPDMLSKVSVTACVNNVWYKTENTISLDDATTCIRKVLEKECSDMFSSFFWDESLISSWKSSCATQKQGAAVTRLLQDCGYEVSDLTDQLSKYSASITIDYLQKHSKNQLQLQHLKAELDKAHELQKKKKDIKLPSKSVQYKSFSILQNAYKDTQIIDREHLFGSEKRINQDFVFQAVIKPNDRISSAYRGASLAQKNFLKSLLDSLAPVSDISGVQELWVSSFLRAASVSALIDTLKILQNDLRYNRQNRPFLYLLEHTYRYQKIGHTIQNTFPIRVVYSLTEAEIAAEVATGKEKWNTGTWVQDSIDAPELQIPEDIEFYPDFGELNPGCLKQIKILNSLHSPSTRLLEKLKSDGIDQWSRLKMADACSLFDPRVINLVKEQFPGSGSKTILCLRWYGRGLRLEYCIKKVKECR